MMDPNALDAEEKAASMRRTRAGKKGYITRLVKHVRRLVSESGSHRQIRMLMSRLLEVLQETRRINSEVLELSGNDGDDIAWMEDVNFTVDVAATEVDDYLEARAEDPESTLSLTESWVKKHCSEGAFQQGG